MNDFQQEKESTVWANANFNTEFQFGEEFPVISKPYIKKKRHLKRLNLIMIGKG
ncbi:MAG: hypothetical protein ACKO96_12175 [Flammeovirgaceae bacterium]